MVHSKKRQPALQNRLLAALPGAELKRIKPHLRKVDLRLGQTLTEAFEPIEYVYFLDDAMASLLSIAEDGRALEIGLVGHEGLIGVPGLLQADTTPYRVIVQVAGKAQRIKLSTLRESFNDSPDVRQLILRYLHALMTQIAQATLCSRFHSTEQRLARWLLASQDRSHEESFLYTQEFLAHILGTDRSSVTLAAGIMKRAGLIDYSRGEITILDREGLEDVACECYEVMKKELEDLLKS